MKNGKKIALTAAVATITLLCPASWDAYYREATSYAPE